MNETYVIFGIDMETDVGSFTPFYETTKSGTQKILNIFESHGFKGTFFFTGECAKENPDIVKMVIDSDHEVGAHSLFHETVGDELFPIPGVKPLLPEEVPNRIRLATEWVEKPLPERFAPGDARAYGLQPQYVMHWRSWDIPQTLHIQCISTVSALLPIIRRTMIGLKRAQIKFLRFPILRI